MSKKQMTERQADWLQGIRIHGDADGASKRQLNLLIKRGWVEICNADKPEHLQYCNITADGLQALKVYYVQQIIHEHMPANNDKMALAINIAADLALYLYDV